MELMFTQSDTTLSIGNSCPFQPSRLEENMQSLSISPNNVFDYRQPNNAPDKQWKTSETGSHRKQVLEKLSASQIKEMAEAQLKEHYWEAFSNDELEELARLTYTTADSKYDRKGVNKAVSETVAAYVTYKELIARGFKLANLRRGETQGTCDFLVEFEGYTIGLDPFRSTDIFQKLIELRLEKPKCDQLLDALQGNWEAIGNKCIPQLEKPVAKKTENLKALEKKLEQTSISCHANKERQRQVEADMCELEETLSRVENDLESNYDSPKKQIVEDLQKQLEDLRKVARELGAQIGAEKTDIREAERNIPNIKAQIQGDTKALNDVKRQIDKLKTGNYDSDALLIFKRKDILKALSLNQQSQEFLERHSNTAFLENDSLKYKNGCVKKHTDNIKAGMTGSIGINDFTDPDNPRETQSEEIVTASINELRSLFERDTASKQRFEDANLITVRRKSSSEFEVQLFITKERLQNVCKEMMETDAQSYSSLSSTFNDEKYYEQTYPKQCAMANGHDTQNKLKQGKMRLDNKENLKLNVMPFDSVSNSSMSNSEYANSDDAKKITRDVSRHMARHQSMRLNKNETKRFGLNLNAMRKQSDNDMKMQFMSGMDTGIEEHLVEDDVAFFFNNEESKDNA